MYKYLMYICLLLNAIQNIFHQILTWYQSTLISSRFFFSFQNFFVCEGSPMATSLESVTTIDEPHPLFFFFFFRFGENPIAILIAQPLVNDNYPS